MTPGRADHRILILAPAANDARLSADFLGQSGLDADICADAADLNRKIGEGCGALLLAEEVLVPGAVEKLVSTLRGQPSWSDTPVILAYSKGRGNPLASPLLRPLGSACTIALVERPFRPETLVSMITAALRSRARQYQVRDLVTDLRASEARARRIFEQTVVGIAEMDFTGRFTQANDRYCAIAGREREELLRVGLADLVHVDDVEETRLRLSALAAGSASSFIVEKRLVRPDGSVAWVHDHLAVIRDAQDRRIGLTVASADITSLKAYQEDLVQARDEALAASRAKDDFLASLSHELRTPLNPVLLLASEGASNVLLPPDVRSDFRTITRSVNLEARLIDDLLDLTRVTRGQLRLHRQIHPLHSLLEEALSTVRADIEAKNIQLALRLAAEEPSVSGDALRLQQVFWNVLKNAAKFTPAGGAITIETERSRDGRRSVIRVTDTGIGLRPGEIDRIFDPFTQGDHGTRLPHAFGGLGLGLAICKRLVELHGGTIAAASDGPELGATFTIELPVTAGSAVPARPPAPVHRNRTRPAETRRILIVEDHEPTRTTLAALLRRRGFEVHAAASVAEAISLAGRNALDLVVSDIGLPDGSGYDLMKRLAAHHRLRGIAVTGYGMEKDVERSAHAGFVAHLTKPISVDDLDQALKSAMAEVAG